MEEYRPVNIRADFAATDDPPLIRKPTDHARADRGEGQAQEHKWLIEHHGDAILRLGGVTDLVRWQAAPAELVLPAKPVSSGSSRCIAIFKMTAIG